MVFGKAMGAWVSAAEAALSMGMGTPGVSCFAHAKLSTALALALAREGMSLEH